MAQGTGGHYGLEISIVMPYWRRPDALAQNLEILRRFYDGIEIIVVDDGSPEPAEGDATIIRLPEKKEAKNPCVPLNIGVESAKNNIIVLTNPEVIHTRPILGRMLEELEGLGKRGYVAAGCYSPSKGKWFCGKEDKSLGRAKLPKGAGLHFCAMLYRDFYRDIGGFCEDYRDGQAFEDNDFLWKIKDAGGKFSIRGDLVTHHIDCPPCKWPKGGIARNKKIFEEKWGS